MDKIEYLNYDESVDHLTIYKADEKIVTNKEAGLVLLSLNDKKEVVGIEVMGIHNNLRVPLEVLKNLNGCEVQLRYDPDKMIVIINIMLKFRKQNNPLVFSSSVDLGHTALNERFACGAA